MVGLKSFWIIISTLFVLAACVPQTKQTECSSNEAFNASLRTCVPVVGGPSSFIKIDSYSPMFTQTRSKDDNTTLTFTIAVSNPYNQSYSVEWERVFNAGPVTMCSNALSCSFNASSLGVALGEVGTHILTAKIKDGNGAVVDSHPFELKIDDLPKPVINTSTITPSTYAFEKLPTDPRVQFSLTVKNNNATISAGLNYRTTWTVQKNGSTLYTETDTFTNFALTGTNSAYLGVSPTPYFNPATLGVGSYIVRAVVQNDSPGEIVAEQQWGVIVKQPDLANVTTIASPAPGVTITTHNNIDYNDYPTMSWVYSGTTQPNFCVTVDDGDGTYASDGKAIQVRWYLDSLGGEICQKTTTDTPGTQTICLNDLNVCTGSGLPFDLNLLKFSNMSSTVTQTHKVTARLFDEATTYEFERADVIPSSGSYPIEWSVLTKPVNMAPVLAFGSVQPTGCITSGSYTKSNCQVNQGTNFTVSFTVADDFYSMATDADKVQWDVALKRNGADFSSPSTTTTCTKAFGSMVPAYGTQYTCTIAVPHYDATGPLHPTSATYSVVLTAQDFNSPVGGTGLASQSLNWNLVVTETNTAPNISLAAQNNINTDSHISKGATVLDPAVSASYATELDSVVFRMNVTDPEVDNFKYRVSLCTDNTSACATSTVLTSPAYVDFLRVSQTIPSQNPVLAAGLLYTIPEDLLIGRHSTTIDIDTVTSRKVYFKVDVTDVPSVLSTTARSDSKIYGMYVRNYNPAPVITTTAAVPTVGSTTKVYSGVQFTVDPGTVTDASGPASERNLQYQWYSKIGAGAWTAIPAATSRVLRYTPGNIASTIDLKLCVGDGTAANPVLSSGNCSGSWYVDAKPYLNTLTATGSVNLQNEVAVWYDDTNSVPNTQVIYSAYVDEDEQIFVEKTIKNTSDNIVLSTQTIEFSALDTGVGTAGVVSNLSIAGSDNSVYIAYLASASGTPTLMYPAVRRIDKSFVSATSQAKLTLSHPAPFGFNYIHYGIACSTPASCTIVPGDGLGGAASIKINNTLAVGETITINGHVYTGADTPTSDNQICSLNACATVNSTAASLASKINNSPAADLQGMTATVVADTVTIYSQYHFDYADFGMLSASNGLGRIYVTGGRWHLPVINASLAGSEQNNITMLTGPADVHLGVIGDIIADDLTDMGKVAAFDNKVNSMGEMVFATISAEISDAGRVSLYRWRLNTNDWSLFDTSGGSATDQNELQIFGTYSFEYVKLAANNTSNNYYYVIAREKAAMGGEYHMGRYNYELDSASAVSENFVTAKVLTTDATDDMITDTKMKFPEIVSVPGSAEARIVFHSVGTGAVPYPRIARWKTDDTIMCGTCFSLSGTTQYQSTSRIGISQVANDLSYGTAGATANENVNDMLFMNLALESGTPGVYKPILGTINVETEAIQSTAVSGTGLYLPPIISD